MIDVFKDLNSKQEEAVKNIYGPLLVLAGAGSGKTRVITHRVAYMIDQGIAPLNILAVTFTNKAAREMSSRVIKLLDEDVYRCPYMGTFHALCVRILRQDIDKIGKNRNFVIYDEVDQRSVIKECMKELDIDEKKYRPNILAASINKAKDDIIDFESYQIYAQAGNDVYRQMVGEIFGLYQKKLERNNALDFGDLLALTISLWKQNPDVLEKWQDRFLYIMVDEYQDTNHAQYILMRLLAQKHKNICVVGDEDQSIYSWRGADVKNILDFEKDYKNVKIVRLEENYRSTKKILETAHNVISNNICRKEKRLWTNNEDGLPVIFKQLSNENTEADYVAYTIRDLLCNENYSSNDIAVFYRTNAQSRVLESALRKQNLNYTIIGNVRFYERKEIKDIIGYLYLISNPSDSIHLKRIINVPSRGLGRVSLEHISRFAKDKKYTLSESLNYIEHIEGLQPRIRKSMSEFTALIENLRHQKNEISPSDLTVKVIEETGYLAQLQEENTLEAESKIENIKELVSAIKEFEEYSDDTSLETFLEQVSLISDIDTYEQGEQISLMTLHVAKGLEFKTVFIVGIEEGLLPHVNSSIEGKELEEERRLCYVGMTRAKQRLYLTCASERRLFGNWSWNMPSRFINEAGLVIDSGKICDEKGSDKPARSFSVGEIVRHSQFGEGKILDASGSGDDVKIVVLFNDGQWKKLLVKYANLEKV